MNTYIFDIARGSTNDGPGIRTTVFLKGCPLKCLWCHNPESQKFTPQISYNKNLCINCGRCETVCPAHAHNFNEDRHNLNFSLCIGCGKCVKSCPSSALTMFGYSTTEEEVFKIIKKDKEFFEQSGGGVTLSGGEPLSHGDFCFNLLEMCRKESIHTCVETSGMGNSDTLKKLAEVTDLFLYDWKISNNADAGIYIGASPEIIQHNLNELFKAHANILLRCPIIPGVNDTTEHFMSILAILSEHPALKAELLPYHSFGINKGERAGLPQHKFAIPTEEQKEKWICFFKEHGCNKIQI